MNSTIMGANLWVVDANLRLATETLQLPALKRKMEERALGGGYFALDLPGEVEPLEAMFSLNGSHDLVRSLFGRDPGDWTNFYYYERLRDLRDGKNLGRIVQLRGLVNEVEQSEVKAKKAEPTKYKIGSLVYYRDVVDGRLIHLFDVFNNRLVINGLDYTAEHNRLIAA